MSGPVPLLEAVAGLLQRTYDIRSGLEELSPFVIGDEGYRQLYRPGESTAGSGDDSGARTLVRETDEGVRACIYFPDALIRKLERFPPNRGLREENLEPFATFVEEIDHLLVVAECVVVDRSVSLFELELHADVSKFLVLSRFLAGSADRLTAARRIWLRRRLFDVERFSDDDPHARDRYRDAARWAVRMVESIPRLPTAERIGALRRFHGVGASEKLELIRGLAA